MLNQDINLFKPFDVAKPAENFLNGKRLGYAYLLATVFFTLLYFTDLFIIHRLNTHATKLQVAVKQYEKEFLALKKNYPDLFFSTDVGLTIEGLQKELKEQKALLDSLRISTTFSRYLITFSNDIVPNVWLTSIVLSDNGNIVSLKGKSIDMETLQQFITRLTNDTTFNSFIFTIDNIVKAEHPKDNGHLLFELSMRKTKP